jgi:hypothetical protein
MKPGGEGARRADVASRERGSARVSRLASVIALVVASLPGCSSNVETDGSVCPEFSAQYDWGQGLDIEFRARAFMNAAAALQALADRMLDEATQACESLATTAKRDPSGWSALPAGSVDRAKAACAEAQAGIDAILQANASVQLSQDVAPGACEIDMAARSTCRDSCIDEDCLSCCDALGQSKATCTPPKVTIQVVQGQASSDLQAVIADLQTRLPTLMLDAGAQGQGALDAANRLATVGHHLETIYEFENNYPAAKKVACAHEAGAAVSAASPKVQASVELGINSSSWASGSP